MCFLLRLFISVNHLSCVEQMNISVGSASCTNAQRNWIFLDVRIDAHCVISECILLMSRVVQVVDDPHIHIIHIISAICICFQVICFNFQNAMSMSKKL
jgi:hypothetical protein